MILTPAQKIMVEDGFPPALFIDPASRAAAWAGRTYTAQTTFLKAPARDEDPTTKKLRAELEATAAKKKAASLERLQEWKIFNNRSLPKPELNPRAVTPTNQQESTMTALKTNPKTTSSKSAQIKNLRERRAETKGPKAAKKASRGAKAAKTKARTSAAPKPTSAAAKGVRPGSKLAIVVGLLKRPEGCTTADVLKATDWPAVSMPQQARAAGLTLRQEKDGKVTRYWAA